MLKVEEVCQKLKRCAKSRESVLNVREAVYDTKKDLPDLIVCSSTRPNAFLGVLNVRTRKGSSHQKGFSLQINIQTCKS